MKKIEFTKVSPHNHFGGKGADCELNSNTKVKLFPFDLKFAKTQIDEAATADFEMLGFTNKNIFSEEHFLQLRTYAKSKGINLIPGVEINLVNSISALPRKYLHVVLLIKPESDLKIFSSIIAQAIAVNLGGFLTIEQMVDLVFQFKSIVIPHGTKQDERSGVKNQEQLHEIFGMLNIIPIIIEDNKEANKKILLERLKSDLSDEKYEYLDEIGSISSLDRQKPNDIKYPSFIWGDNSFDSLFYASIIGKKRICRENDISDKSQYLTRIEISNAGGALKDSSLLFSHGLNTIIGASGSGKTLLLNLIKKQLTGTNLCAAVSSTNCDYDELYKNSNVIIYDNKEKKVSPNEINVFEGENLYKQIISTFSSDKSELLKLLGATPNFTIFNKIIENFNSEIATYIRLSRDIKMNNLEISSKISQYISSAEFLKVNKANDQSISFLINPKNGQFLSEKEKECNEFEDDLTEFTKNLKAVLLLSKKYEVTNFELILKKLYIEFENRNRIKFYQNQKEIFKIKAVIDKELILQRIIGGYNKLIGEKYKLIMESNQSLHSSAEKVIELIKSNFEKKLEIKTPILSEENLLSGITIDNSSDVRIAEVKFNGIITYDNLPVLFGSCIGNSQNKINKTIFKTIFSDEKNILNEKSLRDILSLFIESNYEFTSFYTPPISEVVTYNIQIQDSQDIFQEITSLSAGQLSKIYVNKLIDKNIEKFNNNAIILYDQPDNNLEKKFILEVLCEKLAELKKKYQVFITTHEPLLVVNADSNVIIRAQNTKYVDKLSEISFENLSFVDSSNTVDVVTKISELIDGSHNSVKLRNQIYGGMKK